jgi:hypothetical protein
MDPRFYQLGPPRRPRTPRPERPPARRTPPARAPAPVPARAPSPARGRVETGWLELVERLPLRLRTYWNRLDEEARSSILKTLDRAWKVLALLGVAALVFSLTMRIAGPLIAAHAPRASGTPTVVARATEVMGAGLGAGPGATAIATPTIAGNPTATPTPGSTAPATAPGGAVQQALYGIIALTNTSGRSKWQGYVRPVTKDGQYACGNGYTLAGTAGWFQLALNYSGQSGDSALIGCYIYVSAPSKLAIRAFDATNVVAMGGDGKPTGGPATLSYANPHSFTPCYSACGRGG